ARRLGTVGYYVLLPNLYYRAGRDTIYGPDVQEEGSAEHKRMRAVRTKMTIPPVMDDIGAMVAFAEQQKDVRRGSVGCHGYCMSVPMPSPPLHVTPTGSPPLLHSTGPGSSARLRRVRICHWARWKVSSTLLAPSTTIWRHCRWSTSFVPCLHEPGPPV